MTNALNKMGWLLAALVSIAALAALTGLVSAGPLDPPGPPTTGTMKTLSEVEPRTPISSLPYTISSPGSYYLTGNLSCAFCNGITISAQDVTLDLMGFTLTGTGPDSFMGIYVPSGGSAGRGLSIRNGQLRNWEWNGISASSASDGLFEGLRLIQNGVGISVGPNSIVSDCVAAEGTNGGIQVWGDGGIVRDCTVTQNGADGIAMIGNGGVIANNTANGNAGPGIIANGRGNRIEGNNAVENNNWGIGVSGCGASCVGNVIVRNTAYSNATNYSVPAGNTVGPIIAGPVDPIASTNPWANFSQ